ncbi:hypothetical protein K435DRAFT_848048 [Dendrothele bispora CBS 962.96]|uniref:Uncharacterized protein n=1 Tax=Dendrothele bispora (strain CBS 962.96) TaxID=1314807 RepID=A0A4S8MWD2_DENBC|nr:hypothetical protein K435DRAFT_848048 [Dendrothele bispora CBS 962.96]
MNHPHYPHSFVPPQYLPTPSRTYENEYYFPPRHPGSGSSIQDEFSPEYANAVEQNTTFNQYEEEHTQRLLHVRTRPRERTQSSGPRFGNSSRSASSYTLEHMSPRASRTHSPHVPISGHSERLPETYHEPMPSTPPTSASEARMRKHRFFRVKDSLSLPYTQSLMRSPTANKKLPPPLQLAGSRPYGHDVGAIPINAVSSTAPPARTAGSSGAPSIALSKASYPGVPSSLSNRSYSNSPKQLAPLPRYDPFSRPRADSMSSVIESPVDDFDSDSDDDATPTTPNTRMKRQTTVDNIHARVNYQARILGMGTQL